jgi:hypothetical protein
VTRDQSFGASTTGAGSSLAGVWELLAGVIVGSLNKILKLGQFLAMSIKLLAFPEAKVELKKLQLYLTHLPASVPDKSEFYHFESFTWDPEKAEDFGGIDSAVNHAFEIIFCPQGRQSGPINFKEQGSGLVAVVDVLEAHIKSFPKSAILQKWIFNLIDAAKNHGVVRCIIISKLSFS